MSKEKKWEKTSTAAMQEHKPLNSKVSLSSQFSTGLPLYPRRAASPLGNAGIRILSKKLTERDKSGVVINAGVISQRICSPIFDGV